jgi:hypothetical protein
VTQNALVNKPSGEAPSVLLTTVLALLQQLPEAERRLLADGLKGDTVAR